ncbi:hypothetical protein V6N11_082343 [Hibiscus sabdariffa]|uniref:Uncharacterized protein n=1 Tax=Hibiscus sabdariffa TaxID=183260 RepID=A0ABR2PCL9_9ROSI
MLVARTWGAKAYSRMGPSFGIHVSFQRWICGAGVSLHDVIKMNVVSEPTMLNPTTRAIGEKDEPGPNLSQLSLVRFSLKRAMDGLE